METLVDTLDFKVIQQCITNAEEKADSFIEKSSSVESIYEKGNKNNSYASTFEGTFARVKTVSAVDIEEAESFVFFGEHIREAVNVVKRFLS